MFISFCGDRDDVVPAMTGCGSTPRRLPDSEPERCVRYRSRCRPPAEANSPPQYIVAENRLTLLIMRTRTRAWVRLEKTSEGRSQLGPVGVRPLLSEKIE